MQRAAKRLREALEGLDKWSAFDISKESELAVKSQIAVNRQVYDIITPVLEDIEGTMAAIDLKYKQRQGQR
mgnify:CR=1 FL=1